MRKATRTLTEDDRFTYCGEALVFVSWVGHHLSNGVFIHQTRISFGSGYRRANVLSAGSLKRVWLNDAGSVEISS
jgi:hypothetical protein